MRLPSFVKQNKKTLLFTLLLGVLAVTISSVLTYYAVRYESVIRQFGWVHWLFFYVCTCVTMAFALTPTTFIALLSGYFLGWESVPFIGVSYMLACWIGYRMAAFFDKGNFMTHLEEHKGVKDTIERIKTGQTGIIILSRLSPILPFAIMNVVFAMVGANLRKFIWGSFVGMLPRTLLAIWLGTQAKAIRILLENPEQGAIAKIGLIVLTAISLIGITFFMLRAARSKKPSPL